MDSHSNDGQRPQGDLAAIAPRRPPREHAGFRETGLD